MPVESDIEETTGINKKSVDTGSNTPNSISLGDLKVDKDDLELFATVVSAFASAIAVIKYVNDN